MALLVRLSDWERLTSGDVTAGAAIVRKLGEFALVDIHHPSCPAGVRDIAATPTGSAKPRRFAASTGPGSELKKILAAFGIVASPGCACNSMAARMNAAGPDGCERMIPEIIATMKTEAEKRRLPFIEAAARLLVKKAIRNARKA